MKKVCLLLLLLFLFPVFSTMADPTPPTLSDSFDPIVENLNKITEEQNEIAKSVNAGFNELDAQFSNWKESGCDNEKMKGDENCAEFKKTFKDTYVLMIDGIILDLDDMVKEIEGTLPHLKENIDNWKDQTPQVFHDEFIVEESSAPVPPFLQDITDAFGLQSMGSPLPMTIEQYNSLKNAQTNIVKTVQPQLRNLRTQILISNRPSLEIFSPAIKKKYREITAALLKGSGFQKKSGDRRQVKRNKYFSY